MNSLQKKIWGKGNIWRKSLKGCTTWMKLPLKWSWLFWSQKEVHTVYSQKWLNKPVWTNGTKISMSTYVKSNRKQSSQIQNGTLTQCKTAHHNNKQPKNIHLPFISSTRSACYRTNLHVKLSVKVFGFSGQMSLFLFNFFHTN